MIHEEPNYRQLPTGGGGPRWGSEDAWGKNDHEEELPHLPCVGLKSRSIAPGRHLQKADGRKMGGGEGSGSSSVCC